jgi:dynein heavy chain
MGKYCVLFNCSQGVSIRTLQKLLSGLCYTASWLCLDEINRLNIEIMSVVANQITTIKNAVNQKK